MPKIIKSGIVQEAKSYFKEYAVDTIEDRAIPSIIDGLKPVQRKILYTMWDLKLDHKTPRRKVNTIAGSVLRFSVHGDASVAGAINVMTQDFKTNVPFMDGMGNFGSIDSSPAAHGRYCCTGDTMIVEKTRGLMSHYDVAMLSNHETDSLGYIDLSKHDLEVKGPRGQWVPVKKMVDSGIHDVYKVTLSNGMELKCTSNHPLLVPSLKDEDGLPTTEWRRVEHLIAGDSVCVDACVVEDDRPLTDFEIKEAKFLGSMISEGCVSTDYRIILSNSNKNILQTFLDFYNMDKSMIKPVSSTKVQCYNITNCSKEKYEELLTKYEFGRYSNERRIPSWVFSKPKEYKRILLKYLFEGDGSVSAKIDPRRPDSPPSVRIAYVTNSKRLRDDVRWLLAEFGIASTTTYDIRDRRQGISNKVDICSRFMCERFRDEIGFLSERKNKILNDATRNKIEITSAASQTFTVNCWNSVINATPSISSESVFKTNFFRKYNILTLIKDYLLDFYKWYIPVRIKSIEKLENKERVYSLVIDNDEHAYITNGIVSHNTEARMSEYADEIMLHDMKAGATYINWTKSYDDRLDEPLLLPVRLPNLLINGSPAGIAVGYAANHVPHNPLAVIDLCKKYIANRNMTIEEMIDIIVAPDFPTGGVINGLESVVRAYTTGKGSCLVRGRYKTRDERGNTVVTIYEVPYGTTTEQIQRQIGVLADENKIKLLRGSLHDHTDMNGVKLEFTIKKDEDVDRVINTIYKETDFEFRVNMMNYVLTKDRHLKLATLKDMVQDFIEFREETVYGIFKEELAIKEKRIHLLDALVIISKDMDNAISLIRKSKGKQDAKEKLMKKYKLDDVQAEYIVTMQVYRLSSLEIQAVIDEQNTLKKRCKDLMAWTKTTSNKYIDKYILDELTSFETGMFKNYNKRKTKLMTKYEHISTADTLRDDPVTIVVSREGYIKKMNGHVENFDLGIDDDPVHVIKTSETKTLIVVTDKSHAFNIKVHNLDFNKRGRLLRNIVLAKDYESVLSIWVDDEKDNRDVLTLSEDGMIKSTKIDIFRNISNAGKLIMDIGRKGTLVGCCRAKLGDNIVIATSKGQLLLTKNNIRSTGNGGVGVIGIKLRDDDKCVGLVSTNNRFTIVTNTGYYKNIPLNNMTEQSRGGYGVIGHNCKDCNIVDIKVGPRFLVNIGTGIMLGPIYDTTEHKRSGKGSLISGMLNSKYNVRSLVNI